MQQDMIVEEMAVMLALVRMEMAGMGGKAVTMGEMAVRAGAVQEVEMEAAAVMPAGVAEPAGKEGKVEIMEGKTEWME
ncbi:hypothetical protein [Pectobacterium wasabiae]|uniref:hypothetical protein n=1 Tax=Pectobacterium wasabiae TaxID=55208 RepID=UPI00027B0CE2|nr:hypothetical protein [Pectobacterium wasabiae]EJS95795.1 Hypothetical protein Y17_0770 [Pectobacterium wasabiae CFBP 3304]